MTALNISSKATRSIVTKFHIERHWAEGRKVYIFQDHITNMASMPFIVKSLYRSFFSRTSGSTNLKFDVSLESGVLLRLFK